MSTQNPNTTGGLGITRRFQDSLKWVLKLSKISTQNLPLVEIQLMTQVMIIYDKLASQFPMSCPIEISILLHTFWSWNYSTKIWILNIGIILKLYDLEKFQWLFSLIGDSCLVRRNVSFCIGILGSWNYSQKVDSFMFCSKQVLISSPDKQHFIITAIEL